MPEPSPLAGPRTKIVATLGPASESEQVVTALVRAGVDVVRLNFSHGVDQQAGRAQKVRAAAAEVGRAVSILGDIQGPKIRLGTFHDGKRMLDDGTQVRLVPGTGRAGARELVVGYESLLKDLEPGHRVLLCDGAVELLVEEVNGAAATARVVRGGLVGDRKGVHLPDTTVSLPLLGRGDIDALDLAREHRFDMVGVSFVTRGADLREVGTHVPEAALVAKIERRFALENLDDILSAAEGVMVARGDLGVELALEDIPFVQKEMLQQAASVGCFTITATEMLESMIHATRPTRAEVSDVAHAVLDGTDAVMLSAETAIGDHPVEVVRAMKRILERAEASQMFRERPRAVFRKKEQTIANATAAAAVEAATDLGLRWILAFTETGTTPRLLSRYRPDARIIAFTPSEETWRKMAVLWGVEPILFPRLDSTDEMIARAGTYLLEHGLGEVGEGIAIVAGVPPHRRATTNLLKLQVLGELQGLV